MHVWRLINPVCCPGGAAHKSLIVAADGGREKKRSNSPMWMIESESADFHSWLKKTATSNKAGGTFMLSRDISPPPSTPDKPRLPGREPTDLNPEEIEAAGFSPSAGRSRKFPSVFAWRSRVGASLAGGEKKKKKKQQRFRTRTGTLLKSHR